MLVVCVSIGEDETEHGPCNGDALGSYGVSGIFRTQYRFASGLAVLKSTMIGSREGLHVIHPPQSPQVSIVAVAVIVLVPSLTPSQ